MNPEQKIVKQEKDEQDDIDSLFRQTIGKDHFFSLSRADDSPVQLIQLLHSFEQQESGKVSKSSEGDNCDVLKNTLNLSNGVKLFSFDPNGIKESVYSCKGFGSNAKGIKSKPAQIPAHKFPEAVVAFAQAAAKATGEPEKYLPGWPLLSPSKPQLQKCDKCNREFCSFINYRRHIRVHRRSLNVFKESPKTRDFLGAFWDKLSVDEAKTLLSLKNVAVEDVTGASITKALSLLIRRPGGLSSLPQVYFKAGLSLLDAVLGSPSMLPVSSQRLFRMLDEASENTFLCAGTALSLQKYVFDGEAVKKALEIKNLVACTSFLIEMELVKAWLADKDAEALRCQKLLVEEEETAQRRQAELLKRKRLKKLRHKEQKVKEISNDEKIDFKGPSHVSTDCTESTEVSSPSAPSECTSEASLKHDPQFIDSTASSYAEGEAYFRLSSHDGNTEKNTSYHHTQTENQNFGSDGGTNGKSPKLSFHLEDAGQDVAYQNQRATVYKPPNHLHAVDGRLAQNILNGFQAGQVSATRSSVTIRHVNFRDPKVFTRASEHKVWTIKSRPDNEGDVKNVRDMADRELENQSAVSDRSEVLIGSINVSLGDSVSHHPYTILRPPIQDKPMESDFNASIVTRTTIKLWRPVSCQGNGTSVQNNQKDAKANVLPTKGAEEMLPYESCLASGGIVSDPERCRRPVMFSSEVAKVFLARRWKEAIAGDHVVVISSPETEPSNGTDATEGCFAEPRLQTPDFHQYIFGRAEHHMTGMNITNPASAGAWHLKFRPKADKKSRLKYVPKQKSIATEE